MFSKKSKRMSNKSKRMSNKNKTKKSGMQFTNIKYKDSNKTIPMLNCNICKGDEFKVRTMTMGSKTKSFFTAEFFDNRFKVFTCVDCGNVIMFSNNIKCDGKTCDTSYF